MKKYFLLLMLFATFTSGCGVKDTNFLNEEANQQKPSLLVEFKSNSDPKTTSVLIPSFEMYSNSAYNFVFLYPKDSFVKENGNEIYITNQDENLPTGRQEDIVLGEGTAPSSSFMKVTIHDTSSTLPFMNGRDIASLSLAQQENKIQEVKFQKNHATFQVKDTSLNTYSIHDYFLKNDGVAVETEYSHYSVESQKILEEGLSYFSFIDDWITYKNDAYKFSFKYPLDWDIETQNTFSFVEGLIFPINIPLSKQEKELRETEYLSPYIQIGVTPKNFKNTVRAIENSDVFVSGISQSAIGQIKNIQINNFSGKTGSQSDAIGIGRRVYYLPLSKWNTGLWIDYSERKDGKEKLIEKIISTFQKE